MTSFFRPVIQLIQTSVDVPDGLFEVLRLFVFIFLPRSGDVFDGISEAVPKSPCLDDLDGLDPVLLVVSGVDGVVGGHIPAFFRRFAHTLQERERIFNDNVGFPYIVSLR